MKAIAATLASLLLIAASGGHAQTKTGPGDKPMFSPEDVRMVAPALERYTQDRLLGEVWKRPGLSPRDRSIGLTAFDPDPDLFTIRERQRVRAHNPIPEHTYMLLGRPATHRPFRHAR